VHTLARTPDVVFFFTAVHLKESYNNIKYIYNSGQRSRYKYVQYMGAIVYVMLTVRRFFEVVNYENLILRKNLVFARKSRASIRPAR